MQVEVDVKCMETNFGGHDISGFGDFAPFCVTSKTTKFPFQTMDYSPWGSKNRIGSLVLEILLLFQTPSKRPKFPFGPWTIVHGGQKIELPQKIHASRH